MIIKKARNFVNDKKGGIIIEDFLKRLRESNIFVAISIIAISFACLSAFNSIIHCMAPSIEIKIEGQQSSKEAIEIIKDKQLVKQIEITGNLPALIYVKYLGISWSGIKYNSSDMGINVKFGEKFKHITKYRLPFKSNFTITANKLALNGPASVGFVVDGPFGSHDEFDLPLLCKKFKNFSISIRNNFINLNRNQSTSEDIIVEREGTYDKKITLRHNSSLPEISIEFSPRILIPGDTHSRMDIIAGSGARLGNHSLTIMGEDEENFKNELDIFLNITSIPGIDLFLEPKSSPIFPGGNISVRINLTGINDFIGNASLNAFYDKNISRVDFDNSEFYLSPNLVNSTHANIYINPRSRIGFYEINFTASHFGKIMGASKFNLSVIDQDNSGESNENESPTVPPGNNVPLKNDTLEPLLLDFTNDIELVRGNVSDTIEDDGYSQEFLGKMGSYIEYIFSADNLSDDERKMKLLLDCSVGPEIMPGNYPRIEVYTEKNDGTPEHLGTILNNGQKNLNPTKEDCGNYLKENKIKIKYVIFDSGYINRKVNFSIDCQKLKLI
ncbi:MAG: hypothetical protein NTV25_00310 [Methanothrix sp.]|nr:hypothetical protein [Methanothrix sp.]